MSNYDQFSSEELLQVIEEYGRAEAEKERERIIALLKAENPCPLKGTYHSYGVCSCVAIALIKGENE